MGKNNLTLKLAIAISLTICTLNTHSQSLNISNPFLNPYDPGSNGFTLGMANPWNQNHDAGEYLIYFDHLEWYNWLADGEFELAYKLESVSFPFQPDCINASCIGSTSRNLVAVASVKTEFNLPWYSFNNTLGYSNGYNLVLETPIINFDPLIGPNSYLAQLSSNFYTATGIATFPPIGIPSAIHGCSLCDITLPHTAIKHTIYLICNSSHNIIDSISWVYDNTRGRMRYYPFSNNVIGGTNNGIYDVHFRPEIIVETIYPLGFEAIDNDALYTPNNGQGTIDYSLSHQFLQTAECNGNIINVLPAGVNSAGWGYGYYNGATHIPPYSILFSSLLNAGGNSLAGYTDNGIVIPESESGISTGIRHTYDIYSQDLTQINPKEKIIYNPSEATIMGALTFPSGYSFKTVYGILPERPVVEQYNLAHWNLYDHFSDVPAPIKTNENQSIYHVKEPLTIKPCVLINDAAFDVVGGSVTYDPNQTYGNFTFSGNLTEVHEVQMPECNCKLKCYEPSFYDENDIFITANTTWSPGNYNYIHSSGVNRNIPNQVIKIAGTLEIAPNCTLTLNPGCKIEFGHHGKIVVKPKGKLIINGVSDNEVILTSACELLWEGVALEKYQGAPCVNCNINDYRSQMIANYAIIENANIGVLSKGAIKNVLGKGNYPSGIITANNCIFRNNIVDIQFNPYKRFVNSNPYAQGSTINSCYFVTTGRLLENTRVPKAADKRIPQYHIYLNNVHSVTLSNNTFRCTATDIASDERGTGIYSENSYVMTGDLYPNTFEGLTEGIWASHTGTPDYVRVRGNTFTNCIHSVVLEGTLNSLVVFNTFNIPEDDPAYDYTADETRRGYDKPVGLYLRECKGFRVEENTFNGPGTTPVDGEHASFGIVANSIGANNELPTDNTLPQDNYMLLSLFEDGFGVVYKNIFNNNHIALQSELNNKGSGYDAAHPEGTGLHIGCNDFNNSVQTSIKIAGYDYLLNDDNPFNNYTIRGSIKNLGWTIIQTPRGCDNRFSGSTIDYDISFNSKTEYNIYNKLYYCYSNSIFSGYRLNPTNDIANPKLQPVFVNTASYNCPSNYNGAATLSIEQISKEIEQNTTALKQAQGEFEARVDGGNTDLLLNMMAAHTPAGQIRSTLLQYSPYLSDDVLGIAIDPSSQLPPGIIRQVLAANSPLTKIVLDTMINRNPALPSGIVSQIVAVQSGISERAKLESNMDYYAYNINILQSDLFRAGIEELKLDSVIIKLNMDTSKVNSTNLFPVYLAAGDAVKADSVFTVIKSMGADTNSYEMTMQTINLRMLRDTITPAELDNFTLATADLFTSYNPEQAYKAKALMKAAHGKKSKREPYSEAGVSNRSMETHQVTPVMSSDIDFTFYPNPASDIINIQASEEGNYEITLYNQLGLAVVSIKMEGTQYSIDIRKLTSGVYQLLILDNGELLKIEKIVIIK